MGLALLGGLWQVCRECVICSFLLIFRQYWRGLRFWWVAGFQAIIACSFEYLLKKYQVVHPLLRQLVYTVLLIIVTIRFTCGEEKICSNIKEFQNIMTMATFFRYVTHRSWCFFNISFLGDCSCKKWNEDIKKMKQNYLIEHRTEQMQNAKSIKCKKLK